ncbi:peptidase m20 [Lucifera butyrica]|uniref:Peptidase m20 n=1 Tax=Lucifera butyrica TaxID=1351585 RepID=A0A498R574_9FIRM|nr:M20 family metallopeptidase [Lucifera butyrica]VBB06604.1 peptidase m20 [Lucifera butyrica]
MNSQKEQIFQFIDAHRDEMLALWQELVNLESGSWNKPGIDIVANRIQQVLAREGAVTRILEMEQAGNMLIGELGSDRKKAKVLFLGHMDTVFPEGTAAKRPFTVRDGVAYGPGVLDMKGGIVAALYAIKALQAVGYNARPLKVILAGDEEVAHGKSNAADVFMAEAQGAAAAFNCETGFTDDAIVVGRKGTAVFELEVKGVAVHAGNEPENGRSAILEIAHKVIAIQNLTNWEKGTTFNVGVIQGGTVPNAVPGQAKIVIDVRYLDPALLPEIRQQIQEAAAKTYIQGTTTTVAEVYGMAPMRRTAGVDELFSIVKKTYEEMNVGIPYAKLVGGGSDSAFSVMAGVSTVCAMGVKGGRNHSPEEFAIVESLFERAKLLAVCTINLDADSFCLQTLKR